MSHRDLHIDFNLSIDPKLKAGLSEEELASILPNLIEAHRALHAMHEIGQVQFMHLPYLDETIRDIERRAEILRQQFDTFVVCGIGGSALGAQAIDEGIRGPQFLRKISNSHRILILDTLDPGYLSRVLESLDLNRTVFNIVSKSGNTVETMAQFMWIYNLLKQRIGDSQFRKHLVFTTDPKKGALREIAAREGIESFEILPSVGGRFSVLSPVGLLPAAFEGVSLQELTEGAIRMDKRCKVEDLWTNPAAMLAAVAYLLAEKRGKKQLVLFNYVENLEGMVQWFRQLWAESLGKRVDLSGREISAGITPIGASGPRDQHSQMQLYIEGPSDKMVMFWKQENFSEDFPIPEVFPEMENLGYLAGKTLSEILRAEILASEQALSEAGVPSFRLEIFDTSPFSLGQLFYLFELATVYTGGLFNVNPYDQPGVEQGKKYIYGRLGRQGFEEYGAFLFRKLKDKRYII